MIFLNNHKVSLFSTFILFCLVFCLFSACSPSNQSSYTRNSSIPTVVIQNSLGASPTTTSNITENTPTPNPVAPGVTLNGISVNMTWVYYDTNRVGYEYRVHGFDLPDNYVFMCPVNKVTMQDDTGKQYEEYLMPPPEGGLSDNLVFYCQKDESSNDIIVTQNYYSSSPNLIDSIDLSLRIYLGGFKTFNNTDHTFLEFPLTGPFSFNLKASLGGSLTLFPNLVQNKNSVEAILTQLAINPSVTDASLCISYNNHKGWYPDMTMEWDGRTVQADTYSFVELGLHGKTVTSLLDILTTNRCFRVPFFIPYQPANAGQSTRQMVVTINKLTLDATENLTQEDCANSLRLAQQTYPDLDFSCNIEPVAASVGSWSIEVKHLPSGMDESTAIGIAEAGFIETVQGPFIFTMSVP